MEKLCIFCRKPRHIARECHKAIAARAMAASKPDSSANTEVTLVTLETKN